MVAYSPTPAAADMERGEQSVVLVQAKSPWLKRSWQILAGLLLLALSFLAVFVVVWTWGVKGESMVQSGQKEALLQNTAERSDPHSTLRRISSKAKAAIHLEGIYDSAPPGLQWHSGQGQGFAQGGIDLRDNQIVIPESGLYFVYSQASFRVSCQQQQQPQPTTPLSHRVWRFSDSVMGNVSLMSAVRSACSDQPQQSRGAESGLGWYNAIYLGAVFQLHRGDKLWTETNALSQLETEEGKTFFGVFALF